MDDTRRLGVVGSKSLGVSATVLSPRDARRARSLGSNRRAEVPPRMSDSLDLVVWSSMNLVPQLVLAALWFGALWLAWRVEVRR